MFWRKKIAFLSKILLCCSVSLKKKVFSAIFDEFFDRKLKEKDFKLFYYRAMDYNTTPETEHKLYGLVFKEYEGKDDDLLRIYWFEKKDNNFYFIWIECAIKNE